MRKFLHRSTTQTQRFLLLAPIFCLLTINGTAQTNKTISGDTAFWYKYQLGECEKLNIPLLIPSTDKFHFRFWTDDQAIDIWSVDGTSYNGLITSFINSSVDNNANNPSKEQKQPQTFAKQDLLDTALARQAFKLTTQIAGMPTDQEIKGWHQGFDGIEYVIETSTQSNYSLRSYWTPTAQDSSLLEAKKIEVFVKDLDSLLNLGQKFHDFFASLQPGAYTNGFMITVKLTPEQIQYYKRTKPYRDYLKSISDTLNHYLSDTLSRIFAKQSGLQCYDEFFLKFSTDNRLLKITTNSEFTDREDKRQYMDCTKKIKKAFNQVNVAFVHSQIPYWKELMFSDGTITVFDTSNGGL
jgi:hypothetical protein